VIVEGENFYTGTTIKVWLFPQSETGGTVEAETGLHDIVGRKQRRDTEVPLDPNPIRNVTISP
jgi:hypothetical protein